MRDALRLLNALLLVGALAGLPSRAVFAQVSRVAIVVSDSTGRPVDAAEVSIVRDRATVGTARTAENGSATVSLTTGADDYDVVVRKLGFKRFDRFFTIGAGDSVQLRLTLARVAVTLPTVRVDAQAEERHKRLFIDADAIDNSPRPIGDALDVVGKLRLDMLNGLGDCPVVQEVWVNGKRVTPLIYTQQVGTRRPPVSNRAASESYDQKVTVRIRGTVLRSMPVSIASVLASIRPEHIAEMSYHDCMDKPLDRNGTDNAIFVVLKYGVGFTLSQGSYVVSDSVP